MITWFEIPAFDFEKSVDFYSRVFNIRIEVKSLGSIPYGIMNDKGKGLTGAVMKVKEKIQPNLGPVLFFKVIDMAETLRKIKLYGGEILKEKAIIKNESPDGTMVIPQSTFIDSSVGYYALFRDTEGNKMALYSNS
jgi:predicted enzyme related to lactoylglutathione lyase